jgi:hypothetical protein
MQPAHLHVSQEDSVSFQQLNSFATTYLFM